MKRLVWILLFVAGNAFAATRYASPTGIASGSCLTTGTACTMVYAVSIATDNDTIIALVGTYTGPTTVAAPIACTTLCTFRAETAAECNSRGGSSCSSGVTVTKSDGTNFFNVGNNHHRWEIKGFTVYNYSTGFGFFSGNGSNHLYFTDLTYYAATPTTAIGEGIRVSGGGDDIIITNYTARHDPVCLNTCAGTTDCDYETATGALISVGGGVTNLIIQDSHFGYLKNAGIIRDSSTITIRRNVGVNCVNHGCFELSDVKDVTVENNVYVMDKSGSCSDVFSIGDFIDTYCWENVVIRNNTMVGHGVGPNTFLYHFDSNSGNSWHSRSECNNGVGPEVTDDDSIAYENESVYNNIIYDSDTGNGSSAIACLGNQLNEFSAATTPGYYEDYNVIYDCSTTGDKIGYTQDGSGPYNWADWKTNASATSAADNVEQHGFNSNPTFVTYSADGGLFGVNDDLRLAAGSPAIDAAINTGSYTCPTDDIEKATRSGTCDIGAYNYTASGGGGSSRRRAHITVPKK